MPVSISSTRELEIWVDQNDDEAVTLLAARATFRVLPNLVWTLESETLKVPAPLAMLWTLRCLISAISAILSGDAELIEATKRAAASTQSLGHSTAISNAYYTARSVEPGRGGKLLAIGVLDNPQFAKPERWREIELDAKSIDERSYLDSLMRVPIWRTAPPSDLAPDQRFFEKLKQILGTPASEFWNQWLVEIFEGRAKNWELYREICLIDDAIWRTGPEAVAEEISRIQAEVLSVRLPQAESLQINPETGKFFTNPVSVNNPRLLAAVLTNVEDCLEDAVQGSNGLTKRSSEFRKIARTVDRYSSDPQQAELTLTTVANGIRRQIFETNDLPDSEDNLALLEAVEECVRGIRASHPEVAANREQLARQAFKELKDEDRRILEEAQPILVDISEGNLAVDFAEDIPSLINDSLSPIPNGAPSLPGADAATRIFSRTSRIALLRDKIVKSGKEVHDSPEGKTIRVGLAGLNLGDILYRLVRLGLQLLGVI